MSQLHFTQMSIHSLSWFSRSVHAIIHCLETIVRLKWHLWSTDSLKIPALFLSVLILLSCPFSSANFKALSQKTSGIIHRRSVQGEEGLFQVAERMKPLMWWWAPVLGPRFLSPSLKGELPLAPNSASLLRAQLSAQLLIQHTRWAALSITGRTGRGYLGRETRTMFTLGRALAASGPLCTKCAWTQAAGHKVSSDVKHLWDLCGKGALH